MLGLLESLFQSNKIYIKKEDKKVQCYGVVRRRRRGRRRWGEEKWLWREWRRKPPLRKLCVCVCFLSFFFFFLLFRFLLILLFYFLTPFHISGSYGFLSLSSFAFYNLCKLHFTSLVVWPNYTYVYLCFDNNIYLFIYILGLVRAKCTVVQLNYLYLIFVKSICNQGGIVISQCKRDNYTWKKEK